MHYLKFPYFVLFGEVSDGDCGRQYESIALCVGDKISPLSPLSAGDIITVMMLLTHHPMCVIL